MYKDGLGCLINSAPRQLSVLNNSMYLSVSLQNITCVNHLIRQPVNPKKLFGVSMCFQNSVVLKRHASTINI